MMKLSKENIEEQLLLLADGELGPEAEAVVMAFVEEHEEYRALLDLYLSLKLEPEPEVTFPGRESLLRELPVARPLQWRKVFILLPLAAAVVTFICLAVLFWQKEPAAQRPEMAMRQDRAMTAPSVPLPGAGALPVVIPEDKRKPRKNLPEPAPVRSAVAQARAAGNPASSLPARPQEEIIRLNVIQEPLIAATEHQRVQAGVAEIMPFVVEEPRAQDWTPFKEETVEGMEELVAQVKAIRENVQEKTRMLKNAAIVFRLGDKEFALNK